MVILRCPGDVMKYDMRIQYMLCKFYKITNENDSFWSCIQLNNWIFSLSDLYKYSIKYIYALYKYIYYHNHSKYLFTNRNVIKN